MISLAEVISFWKGIKHITKYIYVLLISFVFIRSFLVRIEIFRGFSNFGNTFIVFFVRLVLVDMGRQITAIGTELCGMGETLSLIGK